MGHLPLAGWEFGCEFPFAEQKYDSNVSAAPDVGQINGGRIP